MAPCELSSTTSADVYFDNRIFNDVLKVSNKDRYVKTQPGISIIDLNKQLPQPFEVPLTYPQEALKDKDPTLEYAI